MPAVLVTTQPTRWQRRARIARRYALAVAVTVLHLVVAAVVLPLRIAHVILSMAATRAAYAELYLATKTGRSPLAQAAGVAFAAALADGFRDGYKTTTR